MPENTDRALADAALGLADLLKGQLDPIALGLWAGQRQGAIDAVYMLLVDAVAPDGEPRRHFSVREPDSYAQRALEIILPYVSEDALEARPMRERIQDPVKHQTVPDEARQDHEVPDREDEDPKFDPIVTEDLADADD